jgi:hypothetical protein
MKDRRYFLNTVLAVLFGLCLAVCLLVQTFAPAAVLPKLSIPNLVLVSLVALLVDHYFGGAGKRCYVCVACFSVLTFGVLPLCAGFVTLQEVWKLAIVGGAVFTVITWLYSSVQERLSSGPVAKAAPVLSAFGLYLAAQCFAGIIL